MEEKRSDQEEKTQYQKVIDGDIEPEGRQKGWKNLQIGQKEHNLAVIDPERAREIRRKGAEVLNQLKGEKRTARESLDNILTLKASETMISNADLEPELAERLKRSGVSITVYDLIQLVATGRAIGGNMKAYELIRDTYGDMPVKQVEITENITTEQDRALLQSIAARLQGAETVQIVESVQADSGTDTNIKGNEPNG